MDKFKDSMWFVFGGQSRKSLVITFVVLLIVYGSAIYGNAATVTQIVFEQELGCVVGWVVEGKIVRHPMFEGQALPEKLRIEYVNLREDSLIMNQIKAPCQVTLK